jgi:hypothetical protein
MNERDKELYQQATGKEWAYDFDIDTAEKFADLIRADEREACAKVCEQPIDEIQITDTLSEQLYMNAHECAAGIRARNNQ